MSTLVIVENLLFGSRGSFRCDLAPERVAEWIFLCLELDYYPAVDAFAPGATRPPRWGTGQYCDHGPAAAAVYIGVNRVLVRYHAAGDKAEAKEWFLANSHVLADGTLGNLRQRAPAGERRSIS
jgi:hypothetical protein